MLQLQVYSPGDYVCKKGDIGKVGRCTRIPFPYNKRFRLFRMKWDLKPVYIIKQKKRELKFCILRMG